MDEDSSNSDLNISNDLTDKIKQSMVVVKSKVNENKENPSDDLQDFILKNSKELVQSGIDAINEIKQTVLMNPQSDEVEALAEIFKGVASAMNILKDIHVAKMKTDNSKEIKEMEIKSKKEIIEDSGNGIKMTRDEIYKMIKNSADVVDTEFTLISS